MMIAKVVGNVVSTVKNENFSGAKLLIIKPLSSGDPIIAIDCIGAGIGETVLAVHEGGSSRIMYNVPNNRPNTPVDAVIIGIVDHIYKEE